MSYLTKSLPDKPLFRPDEVAVFFGVSKKTVYFWIEKGKLPAVKIAGNILRIPKKSIDQIIKPIPR